MNSMSSRKIINSQISLHIERGKPDSLRFKKYLPKYIRELSLISANSSTFIKIKSIKRISCLNTSCLSYSSSKRRRTLGNRIHLPKNLKNDFRSQRLLIERVKFFPNLKCVTISMPSKVPSHLPSHKLKEKQIVHACRMMRYLKNIKELEVQELSKAQKKFIEILSSSPKLLRSLDSLKILCHYEEPRGNFTLSHPVSDVKIIELFERKKILLKHITHLDLDILCSNLAYLSFQGFADRCSKLESLSLPFHCRYMSFSSGPLRRRFGDSFNVMTTYLQTLETFQNLRELILHIGDILTFLKDFVGPEGLKSLELRFEEQFSEEIMRKIDIENADNELSIFEENEIFLRFYMKFQKQKELESLELLFNRHSDSEAFRLQSYFVQTLLKRILVLKRLVVNPLCSLTRLQKSTHNDDDKLQIKEIGDSYLFQFFESCDQFSQGLENLTIGNERIRYSPINFSPFHGKFSKLSRIQITRRFEGWEDGNEILEFLGQIISLGDALTLIKLHAMIQNTALCLLSVFRQLNQLKKSETLKIELEISFLGGRNLEEIGVSCDSVIGELKNYAKFKGVSVKLYANGIPEDMRKLLKAYSEKFESFEMYST